MRITEPAGLRSSRPLRACALALSAALALAACGGGSSNETAGTASGADSSAASGSASAAPTPTDSADDSAAGGGSSAFPTASPVPKGSKAVSGVPAITANATAFDKEPTVAKGTGPAPTKLVVRDLILGTGKVAGPNDTVNVRYVGTLYTDGTVFDASWNRGSDPTTFPLSGVVPGFAGGIVGMKIGGRREIVIPGYLGYGPAGQGPIPPNATLVFVVDLVSLQ